MEDIPQPATDPYALGDHVRVYLSESDTDVKYHGLVCEVISDEPDDLGTETGRPLDSHRYELRRLDTETTLPVRFRHHNLVPAVEDE
jgi:hypothetical protein